MGGQARAAKVDLHHRVDDAQVDPPADVEMANGIVVMPPADMAVGLHLAYAGPLANLVRNRLQQLLPFFEADEAAAPASLERIRVIGRKPPRYRQP